MDARLQQSLAPAPRRGAAGRIERASQMMHEARRAAFARGSKQRSFHVLLAASDSLLDTLEELNLAEVRVAPPEMIAAVRQLFDQVGLECRGNTVQALLDAVFAAQEPILEAMEVDRQHVFTRRAGPSRRCHPSPRARPNSRPSLQVPPRFRDRD